MKKGIPIIETPFTIQTKNDILKTNYFFAVVLNQ